MYIDIYPPVIKRGNGKSTVSWTIFPLKPPLKKKNQPRWWLEAMYTDMFKRKLDTHTCIIYVIMMH